MAASSSSDSDSSSSRSSRSTSPEPGSTQKRRVKTVSKAEEESEDSSSGSDSSSDSESESELESSNKMDTAEDAPKAQAPAKKVNIPAPQPYKPPLGFKSAKKQSPPSSSSSLLSNLRGKQVIHLTAPSYLPLSKVKEISMSKVMKGDPILTYEGKSYGIPSESFNEDDSEGKSLLVFDQSTQTYHNQVGHVPSYHIQEMVNLPGADRAAVEALQDTVKPPRPQPKNLKMRFRPVGSLPALPETLGSDSESDAEKFPVGEREERKRKHHHTEGDASQAAAVPRKKSKKHSSQENGSEHGQKKSKKSHKDGEEKKKRKKSEKA